MKKFYEQILRNARAFLVSAEERGEHMRCAHLREMIARAESALAFQEKLLDETALEERWFL
jgi:hypothetical protein